MRTKRRLSFWTRGLCSTLVAVLAVLTFPIAAAAACPDATNNAGYVRAAASGTGSGADWTNAYTALPGSLVRGCTYYVAVGNYPPYTFQDPDSGTMTITIQAPTVTTHGTNTGWQNSFAGQAVWTPPIKFNSDYYVFTGSYRSSFTSGYGFLVQNNNGSNQSVIAARCPNIAPIVAVGNNAPTLAHDVRILYVEVNGSHDNTATFCDWGINWDSGSQGNSAVNNYLGYSYVHDTGSNPTLWDGQQSATVEYSWIKNDWASAAVHAEGLTLRGSGGSVGDVNFIARYNFIENIVGTAFIAFPANQSGNMNFYFYGNIFFVNQSEANGQGIGNSEQAAEGIMALDIGGTGITGNFYFVNNTMSSLWSAGNCGISPISELNGSYVAVFENNLWYNCTQNNNPPSNPGGSGRYVFDYNAYYSSPTMHSDDNSPHVSGVDSGAGSNPFVNVAQSAGADNFNLTADTAAGTTTDGTTNFSALPPGCTAGLNCINIDMNGTIRGTSGVWDRGAFQFQSSSGPPGPPVVGSIPH